MVIIFNSTEQASHIDLRLSILISQLLLPILDYRDLIELNNPSECLLSLDVIYSNLCRFVICDLKHLNK